MKMKVIELGDKRLRAVSKPVPFPLSGKARKLVSDLIGVCEEKRGVGIAAPQVGESVRIFIVWSRPNKRYPAAPKFGPIAVINPKVLKLSKKVTKGWEGCLSIPGIRALVPRHASVDVSYQTIEGKRVKQKFSGFIARIFQHELDHLNGIVFLDRVDGREIVTDKEYKKIISN